jgi:hypothetical protein
MGRHHRHPGTRRGVFDDGQEEAKLAQRNTHQEPHLPLLLQDVGVAF